MRGFSQAGDTLIEVVISIAILSVTLVTAYNMANSTFLLGIEARERTEAISMAQQQAELLRAYRDREQANAGTGPPFMNGARFPNGPYVIDQNMNVQGCTPALCNIGFYTRGITTIRRHGSQGVTSDIIVSWTKPRGRTGVAADTNTSRINLTLVDRRIDKLDCGVVESCNEAP